MTKNKTKSLERLLRAKIIELYKIYLLKKTKRVYIPIPKTGITTIRQALFHKIYAPYSENYNLSKLNSDKYFKFTFIRNPYDRIVSCYSKANQRFLYEGFQKYKSMYAKMPFKEFVRAISQIPDSQSDEHFKSQYLFITDKEENLIPNFIGRFENLNKDFKKVCKKANVKKIPQLPHRNRSKRKRDYRDYYDKETKRLVQERYKKDFEIFGYEF